MTFITRCPVLCIVLGTLACAFTMSLGMPIAEAEWDLSRAVIVGSPGARGAEAKAAVMLAEEMWEQYVRDLAVFGCNFQTMESSATPQVKRNWRFQMALYRA